MTTVAKQGRRFYLQGLPFERRAAAKAAGCKWDPDAKCWWTGKYEVAEQVAGKVNAAPAPEPAYSPADGETMELLTGNTYPVKDQLRALGATWDAASKGWRVPASQALKARALVASAPASKPRFSGRRGGGYRGLYCYHICPVGGFKCCPENGQCHDCE